MLLELEFAKYCAAGNLSAVKEFLIEHPEFAIDYCIEGIEISASDTFLGNYSPLMAAAKNGHIGVCHYLLKEHIPAAKLNYYGGRKKDFSPLDCAIHWGNNLDLVVYLRNQKAKTHEEMTGIKKNWVQKNEKAIGHTAFGSAVATFLTVGCAAAGGTIGTLLAPGAGTLAGAAIMGSVGSGLGAGVLFFSNRKGSAKDTVRDDNAAYANKVWSENKAIKVEIQPVESTEEVFCRKLTKYLWNHIFIIKNIKLNESFQPGDAGADVFKNYIIALLDQKFKNIIKGYTDNLLLQNLSLVEVTQLQNAFRAFKVSDIFQLTKIIFKKYSSTICQISVKDDSLNNLCKGLSIRILSYIKNQAKVDSNRMKEYFLKGILKGTSNIFDNLTLSLVPTTLNKLPPYSSISLKELINLEMPVEYYRVNSTYGTTKVYFYKIETEQDPRKNSVQSIFCRKLAKYLWNHIFIIQKLELNESFQAGDKGGDVFKNYIIACLSRQFKNIMTTYTNDLLIQNLSLKEIILLKNTFFGFNEETIYQLTSEIFVKVSETVYQISLHDNSMNNLCKGLAIRILNYIKNQEKEIDSSQMVQYFLNGILKGTGNVIDNLKLSLIPTFVNETISPSSPITLKELIRLKTPIELETPSLGRNSPCCIM